MKRKLLFWGFWILLTFCTYGAEHNYYVFEGKTISLKGNWRLVMNDFLSYEEAIQNTTSISAEVPGIWNDLEWDGRKIGAYGYGTYYTQVIVQDLGALDRLALEVSEIGIAYQLYANDRQIGNRGYPGKSLQEEKPKINYGIFDFEAQKQDTVTIIFYISNFEHESGGLWYAPNLGIESKIRDTHDFDKGLSLVIIGCFLLAGIFQLYLFLMRRKTEQMGFFFFLGTLSLVLLTSSRGEMILLDFFPDTDWVTLKKILYISLFTLAPMNGRFLRELFPKYIHKGLINGLVFFAIGVSLFALFTHPRTSYSIVPYYHILSVITCIYLLISVLRAALADRFGARFILVGYTATFLAALHDILVTQYIIEGFSFAMIHIGTIIYIIQLLFVLGGRYVYLLDKTESMSTHLRSVNEELEEKVAQRTLALSERNELIELKNKELEKTLKEKEYLMEVVAHDLKAPFNTIMSITDVLKKELKGKTAEFNQMIKKLTLDGRRIVEEITELKAFEDGDIELNMEEIKAKTFFENKVISFSSLAMKKNIRLNSKINVPQPTFFSDETALNRIVDNLLSNAIKFSPQGSKISFEMHGTDKNITFVITDNGPGFSKEDRERIFKKFQRLSAKPTGGESSTGLGLSIVKALVDLLKGTIDLSSDEGKGARFVVTIPYS